MTDSGPVTTAGVIAVGNLEARIDGQVAQATEGRLTVGERAELLELIALRGHVLGRVADAERAAVMADELVGQVPSDARSFVARARLRGVFHRFASALTDLDTAATLGGDRVDLDAERAAIYQALGRYDEALAIRRLAVDGQADFSALAALAGLYGERGEMHEAEHWFGAATRCYRGTSPFPLAMLELQRGQLWMEHDDLRRARAWCDAAVRRLPAYVPAQGHLADSTLRWGRRRPPSLAFGRWRSHPTIPITRRTSPASWAMPATPRRRRPGVTRPKPAMTSCSRATDTRSPIMPPSSGSRSVAIPSGRFRSPGRISHSVRPLVPARSCAAREPPPAGLARDRERNPRSLSVESVRLRKRSINGKGSLHGARTRHWRARSRSRS